VVPWRDRRRATLPAMTGGRERRFGRTSATAEGLLTYGEYLRVPELLSLQ
jgi:hypothetical protein